MKKMLLIMMSGISLCTIPAYAQFHTVAAIPNRYKVEVLRPGMDKAEPTPESAATVQSTSADVLASASAVDIRKKMWIDRYLGVCYPLRDIRVTSPYGYRKDPFSGKKKFHAGLDLHARSEEVLAMMEGVVVKVGENKTSGKYVIMRHGN